MSYMEQAISLAKLALGQVSPNPAVGAVLVRDNVIVGQGYTQPPGSEHAEIVALSQAGEKSRGSVMYVTLEPCCHRTKRTPPCTEAIISAGVSEVHFSIIDPNPLVSGRGRDALERSGIKTCTGECADEAKEVNEAFLKYAATGMPFVTAKFAISLDGKIATRSGDSKWISGAAARKHVQRLRYVSDAIMTGLNTILVDDPRLTVRFGDKGGTIRKQPLRVIVDSSGRSPSEARIFNEPGRTLVAVSKRATPEAKARLKQAGAELLEIPSTKGLVDVKKLLKALGEQQIASVLVEGGGTLLGSLFDNGLVDKVVAFVAPIIIGGKNAKTAVAGQGIEKMADSIKLKRVKVETIGDDMMVTGYVREI